MLTVVFKYIYSLTKDADDDDNNATGEEQSVDEPDIADDETEDKEEKEGKVVTTKMIERWKVGLEVTHTSLVIL